MEEPVIFSFFFNTVSMENSIVLHFSESYVNLEIHFGTFCLVLQLQ